MYEAQENVEELEQTQNNEIGVLANALHTLQDNEEVPEEVYINFIQR